MGLCKCPKRQITNQFCFEHRVNVCEHCMVTSHPKCIVQSYLQWLKDSDYVSNCTLCGTSLEEGECIRLICYHVFHWSCLNNRQSALPPNTAASGHACPICNQPIFPPSNLISSVAEALTVRLGQVNWGRNELGLSLLFDEKVNHKVSHSQTVSTGSMLNTSSSLSSEKATSSQHMERTKPNGVSFLSNNSNNRTQIASQHSVLLMDTFNPPSDLHANSRRPIVRQPSIGRIDRDENKYKRRTPAEIFSRWSRRFYAPSSRPPWRRAWFLVLCGLIIFIIIIYVMATFGRSSSNEDFE